MKFPVIYIDCPWDFNVWSKKTAQRYADRHYPLMTPDRLLSLPLADVMEKDCAVFSWATFPNLPLALECGKAWGLKYSTTAFVWAKTRKSSANRWVTVDEAANWFMGMGYYTRSNAEICLLFTKGSPKRKSRAVRQLIVSPIMEHSRKPDETYDRIEALMPAPAECVAPYLEVFARRPRPGWVSVGNELTGRDIYDDLAILAATETIDTATIALTPAA